MQTPELAAKWGVEPSELQAAFDFLDAHHLRFVTVIAKAAMAAADPVSTKIVVGELELAAAPTVGVTPETIALILQIIEEVYPVIAQILAIFLGSLTPKPAPTPKPSKGIVRAAVGAIVLLALCGGPALAGGCSTTKEAKDKKHEAPPAAKAALALNLSLTQAHYTTLRKESTQSTHTCVCTFRSGKCDCPDCECNCPDADSYAAALRQSQARGTPIVVWVKTAIDRSVYPTAVHLRDDSFADAEPGVVVAVWRDGGYRRVAIPQGQGGVTRDRVFAAIGYAQLPAGHHPVTPSATLPGAAPCQNGTCPR